PRGHRLHRSYQGDRRPVWRPRLRLPLVRRLRRRPHECLRHVMGAWACWLDADDFVDDANRPKLAALLANLPTEDVAFVVTTRSSSAIPGEEATEVNHVRLFRNRADVRWHYRVHEQIVPALLLVHTRIEFTDIRIERTGYRDPTVKRRKTERNLPLLHRNL